MAAELLPLIVSLLGKAAAEGLKVKVSDEREGVLVECEQEGVAWLVGEDGTIYCNACGYLAESCECD